MKKFLLICFSIMTFFAMSLTTFASSYNPPTLSENYDAYLTIDLNGKPYCFLFNSSDWTPKIERNVGLNGAYYSLNWTQHRSEPYVIYHSTTYTAGASNGGWGTMSQFTVGSKLAVWDLDGTSQVTIYDSNQDIYYGNQLVFQPTPPLAELIAEEMEEFQKTTNQTALTVTLCGVGCLALLIGCHLLRKKSVLWLNR